MTINVSAVIDTPSSTPKRQKFVSLAEKRMARAIKAIRLVGNLGNRQSYEFTDGDVEKIMATLMEEVESAQSRMMPKPRNVLFKL